MPGWRADRINICKTASLKCWGKVNKCLLGCLVGNRSNMGIKYGVATVWGGGGYFTNFRHTQKRNWTQLNLRFCKGRKNLRLMKKGVNWIENQGEKLIRNT